MRLSVRLAWEERKARAGMWAARHLPRWLRYRVVINEASATSVRFPEQEVPSITWDQMAKGLL